MALRAAAEMPDRVTRVLAIRHGETEWNLETRIQGQLDIGLNVHGQWQARQLAQAVADDGVSAVYASDLVRALDTARALVAGSGLHVVADPGLRERGFGLFEGQTYAEINARWPADALRWRQRDPDFGPAGGETLAAFYGRSVACVTRLAARHPGQTVVLVTHGGVLDCLYRAATRIGLQAPRSWQVGNASINRLLYSPEGFTLVGWNDALHLDATSANAADDHASDAGPKEIAA